MTVNIINELKPYMLSSENILKIPIIDIFSTQNNEESEKNSKFKNRNEKNNKNKHKMQNILGNLFTPKQHDKLFWCIYIILNGMDKYNLIHNYFTEEKNEKFKLIEELRNHKYIFKKTKISRNNIEDELANKKNISLDTLKIICHFKNINIFYIDEQKYYEILLDENNDSYVIEKKNMEYGLRPNQTKENIEYYRNNFWKLENFNKPLKAISSYKLQELREICLKLKIPFERKTKQQLYEEIIKLF